MSAQATIASAVSVALSPTSAAAQRQEAYTFLEQIKSSANETWSECLKLFVNLGNDYPSEARLFCLQVVDEALGVEGCVSLSFLYLFVWLWEPISVGCNSYELSSLAMSRWNWPAWN